MTASGSAHRSGPGGTSPTAVAGAGSQQQMVVAHDEVPIIGLPEGLRARVRRQLRVDEDGRQVEVRDRQRRTKLTSVYLFAATPDETLRPTEKELRFLLGADRRAWQTVVDTFASGDSDKAWSSALRFARAGAVEIECETEGARLGDVICWRLTDRYALRRKQQATRRRNEREGWQQRAHAAAEAVESRWEQLAHALRRHAGAVERQVLVYAAEDLLAGRSWAGPRAFSQVHFGTTKARDDVGKILARSGVEVEAQIELGVLRAGRTGLAGPVTMSSDGGRLDFTGIKGPTDVRLDQPGLRLATTGDVLLVVENRQAAEAISDRYPDVALLWSQGAMGPESLNALEQLARAVRRVVVFPDADLGGVRIAEQVLAAAPDADVVNTGAYPHEPRTPWKPDSVTLIGLASAVGGPAGALAQSCLARGYPVEQELAVIDAADEHLAPPAQ